MNLGFHVTGILKRVGQGYILNIFWSDRKFEAKILWHNLRINQRFNFVRFKIQIVFGAILKLCHRILASTNPKLYCGFQKRCPEKLDFVRTMYRVLSKIFDPPSPKNSVHLLWTPPKEESILKFHKNHEKLL